MLPIISNGTIVGDARYVLHSPRYKDPTSSNGPRQISRLYRPLSGSNSSLNLDSDTDDEIDGTQLLPLHNKPDTAPSTTKFPQNKTKKGKGRARSGGLALGNVWDEREELFGVGDDDDDDDDDSAAEDAGEERTQPPPAQSGGDEPPRDTKPVKSVRWAEGSS